MKYSELKLAPPPETYNGRIALEGRHARAVLTVKDKEQYINIYIDGLHAFKVESSLIKLATMLSSIREELDLNCSNSPVLRDAIKEIIERY